MLTTSEIADQLSVAQQTVPDHVEQHGSAYKDTRFHELTAANKLNRVTVGPALLSRSKNEPSLKRLISGKEKWIAYENVVRKRAYCKPGQPVPSTSKHCFNLKMLGTWWNMREVIILSFSKQEKPLILKNVVKNGTT